MSTRREGGHCATHKRNHWDGCLDCSLAREDALQQRLTAADERADVLEGLLRRVVESSVLSFEQDAPESLESLEADICAALKPATAGDCHHGYTSILECPECGEPYQ
ncbi:hypothetical protein [Pseudomonas sp. GV047]|uniref:hypothetical protein n=1 Tax=Pseudomonas sp. GV047 TaxID=2135751 RepID=UPI000D37513F|nr:hypothetical protein [Pseudomonas sp. GV047]PUB43181.1 hypothetical protein C8K58_10763 [Pseudomonas sp. GV047]